MEPQRILGHACVNVPPSSPCHWGLKICTCCNHTSFPETQHCIVYGRGREIQESGQLPLYSTEGKNRSVFSLQAEPWGHGQAQQGHDCFATLPGPGSAPVGQTAPSGSGPRRSWLLGCSSPGREEPGASPSGRHWHSTPETDGKRGTHHGLWRVSADQAEGRSSGVKEGSARKERAGSVTGWVGGEVSGKQPATHQPTCIVDVGVVSCLFQVGRGLGLAGNQAQEAERNGTSRRRMVGRSLRQTQGSSGPSQDPG